MNSIIIDFGGQERGFKFGTWVIGELISDLHCSVEQVDKLLADNPIKVIPMLLFLSAKLYCKKEKQVIDFDVLDVHDWIADEGGLVSEKVVQILKAFNESTSKDVPEVKGDSKKKLTGKKTSLHSA